MRLLLDSNAFIWWRNGSRRLPRRVASEIESPDNEVIVSVASLWEITIKRALGKLQFLEEFEAVLAADTVILAVGQAADLDFLLAGLLTGYPRTAEV